MYTTAFFQVRSLKLVNKEKKERKGKKKRKKSRELLNK